MKSIILTIAMLLTFGAASAQVKFTTENTDKVKAMAVAQNKLVFIDLYADWCPPCKKMERDVFSQKEVGEYMSKYFVSAKYSVDNELGKSLASQYEVSSIPTYLVFNIEGELVGRMAGAMSSEEFISNMEKMREGIIKNAKK